MGAVPPRGGGRVDAVMTGHIAVPALDPTGAPASLSPRLTRQALRGDLGFDGLIVTEGLDMKGLQGYWTGGAAVAAVEAGADVLLVPDYPRVAVQSLVRAVAEGELTEARIDASVRRILEAKARVGLDRGRWVDPAALGRSVGLPEDVSRAQQIAAHAITVVRNRGDVLPLAAERPLRLLHLVLSNRANDPAIRGILEDELEARRIPADTRTLRLEHDTVVVRAHLHLQRLVVARLGDLLGHHFGSVHCDGERGRRRSAWVEAHQLVERRAEALAGEVAQRHVDGGRGGLLAGHRGSIGRRREGSRVAQPRRHRLDGTRGRVAVLAVTGDRRGLSETDAAAVLDLDQQVVTLVAGAAREPEGVAQDEVEGTVPHGDHGRAPW
jgi:hypothetical protein